LACVRTCAAAQCRAGTWVIAEALAAGLIATWADGTLAHSVSKAARLRQAQTT
jgi:hypothetical protein